MIWLDKENRKISCVEKIKILNQNLQELQRLNLTFSNIIKTVEYKDALEDAILLGITASHFNNNLNNYLKKEK